jgi:hypothetical protein
MPDFEVKDDAMIERLGNIIRDMPPYMLCAVPEYSAARPPNKVSSRDRRPRVLVFLT